jgi:hypothetical protein
MPKNLWKGWFRQSPHVVTITCKLKKEEVQKINKQLKIKILLDNDDSFLMNIRIGEKGNLEVTETTMTNISKKKSSKNTIKVTTSITPRFAQVLSEPKNYFQTSLPVFDDPRVVDKQNEIMENLLKEGHKKNDILQLFSIIFELADQELLGESIK